MKGLDNPPKTRELCIAFRDRLLWLAQTPVPRLRDGLLCLAPSAQINGLAKNTRILHSHYSEC